MRDENTVIYTIRKHHEDKTTTGKSKLNKNIPRESYM